MTEQERKEEIDFSANYYQSNLVIIGRKGSKLLKCTNLSEIDQKGFKIVMTVHDEIVLEVPNGISSIDEICKAMNENPIWFKDFPNACNGYECKFYKKE